MSTDHSRDNSLARQLTPDSASDLLAALHEPQEQEAGESTFPHFPGYQVLAQLGRGGAGRVYLATRVGSEARVAIKHLEHQHSQRESQRAWRELELLAQLRAPCLPRVLDYGHHEGRIFIVTEYIEGLSLTAHCQAKHLDRRARVALLVKVAEAVQTLHDHGIIHRDIKPSNVIVNAQGEPTIIDLGIAILLSQDVMQTLTAEGAPIGSPAFMSPEQARGERSHISIRSDVYSLGATAYLLLTGQTPHDTDTTLHEAVRRVAQDPARSPRELDPTIPRSLEAVLEEATAFQPDKRYTTAHDFAEDLQRWHNGECVRAHRQSSWARAMQWARMHPFLASARLSLMIVLSGLLSVAATSYYLMRTPFSIALSPDHSSAALLSPSGAVLYEWIGGAPKAFEFAHFTELRTAHGNVRRVLLGNDARTDPRAPHAGELHVIDPHRPSTPLWTSGGATDDIDFPGKPLDPSGDRFRVMGAVCADVFTDHEGTEIVAYFNHYHRWPALIRIYSVSGEVLAEGWHHGQISAIYFDPNAERLAVAAVNNEYAWTELGLPHAPVSPHPQVFLFVRPETLLHETWLDPHTLREEYGEYYSFLHPSLLASQLASRAVIQSTTRTAPDGTFLAFEHTLRLASVVGAEVTWCFTATGQRSTVHTSSIYEAIEDAPDASLLEWCDLTTLLDAKVID